MSVLVFMKYHGKEQPSAQSRRKLKWGSGLFNMVWTTKNIVKSKGVMDGIEMLPD